MNRQGEASPTRQGLLGSTQTLQRTSQDESPRISSDDDRLEVDLAGNIYSDHPQGRRGSRKHIDEKMRSASGRRASRIRRLRRKCRPSWACLIVTLILVGGIIGVIVAASFWVYRSAPEDGLSPPWYPTPAGGTVISWEESYKKAAVMVNQMSLIEKVNVTTGIGWAQGFCVGNTAPALDAGFPSLCLQDGPLGLRFADHITAFPAALTVGATWNRDLMYRRGRALGVEARLKGVNVLLGPSMGPLGRMPAGGRNWEGFGSDPILQGYAAAETIRGIQDEGVIATAKHFIGNEQEHYRQSLEWGLPNAISSNIDDRTLHELYLWPFAESVKAGVGSVMCSYNMVNNSYACGNSKLMNGILKDELGFQGFVQSDWLAQRSGVASALAGLDMSMPGDGLFWAKGDSLWGSKLSVAVLNGSLPMGRLNDMVTRTVATWFQLKQDNKTRWRGGPNFSSWTKDKIGKIHEGSGDPATTEVNKFVDVQGTGKDFHGRLVKTIAAEGTVLVKNEDNALPLMIKGSPKASKQAKYKVGVFGEDAGPGQGPNACADRGCNQGTLASGWGSGAVDFPYLITPLKALRSTFDSRTVNITSYLTNSPPIKENPSIVEDLDLCLVFINSDGGEGFIASDGIRGDRNDLYSQKGGDDLVQSIAPRCGKGKGKTVVVVHAIGPVVVEKWIDLPGVKAVLLANLPGQESGNAIADVLFGNVDASGRLPYTVGKSLDDYGPGGQILYYPNGVVPQQDFTEGLLIDYRHFDAYDITPRYEFGFGLSYTTFAFSNLSLTVVKPKSPFPDPRPAGLSPPSLDTTTPSPSDALFPDGFKKLSRYIYPYITSTTLVRKGKYPYPKGYDTPQTPSSAGGAQGGNPSLYDIHLNITLTLTNTGARKGKAVVQVYVSFPDRVVDKSTGQSISFPKQVLRQFEKVELEKGKSAVVRLGLTRKDLSYWSTGLQNWVMPVEGEFVVRVGSSSRKLPLVGKW